MKNATKNVVMTIRNNFGKFRNNLKQNYILYKRKILQKPKI